MPNWGQMGLGQRKSVLNGNLQFDESVGLMPRDKSVCGRNMGGMFRQREAVHEAQRQHGNQQYPFKFKGVGKDKDTKAIWRLQEPRRV